MTNVIVTHQSPDWDAIGSAWLLQRYALKDAEIICASREQIEETKATDAAIVDCGGIFDPGAHRFDHHQLEGSAANATCATLQVWDWLSNDGSLDYLRPLILLIWAGDTGRNEHGADASRDVGLHAQLSARKAAGWGDEKLMAWGCAELDLLAHRLLRQAEAATELAEKLVWQSEDGKVVAIEHGEPRHTMAAFAAGATLVVFRSDIETENGTSYAIGVQRNQQAEFPHIGDTLKASGIAGAIADDKWFLHQAGFVAGRGTLKGQRFDAIPDGLTATTVAQALDAALDAAEEVAALDAAEG